MDKHLLLLFIINKINITGKIMYNPLSYKDLIIGNYNLVLMSLHTIFLLPPLPFLQFFKAPFF